TSSSPGCGWSRRWRRVPAPATSTRASARRRGTSTAGSCRRCTSSSTCWSRWTAPSSTPPRTGSEHGRAPLPVRAAGREHVGGQLGGNRGRRLGGGVVLEDGGPPLALVTGGRAGAQRDHQ